MTTRLNARRGGFTLVEIMIVVAIIALLASIAVPSFLRARKRSQATTSLQTLRVFEAAVQQYAIETGKPTGFPYNANDMLPYVKKDTAIYTDLANGVPPRDATGEFITPGVVDTPPKISSATKAALSDALGDAAANDTFWGAYNP